MVKVKQSLGWRIFSTGQTPGRAAEKVVMVVMLMVIIDTANIGRRAQQALF